MHPVCTYPGVNSQQTHDAPSVNLASISSTQYAVPWLQWGSLQKRPQTVHSPIRQKQHRSEYSDSGSDLNQIELGSRGGFKKALRGHAPVFLFVRQFPFLGDLRSLV